MASVMNGFYWLIFLGILQFGFGFFLNCFIKISFWNLFLFDFQVLGTFILFYYQILFPAFWSKRKRLWSRSVVSDSWRPHGLYPTRLLRPWYFPGKSTRVGCHFLLQGIFWTQGLNPDLPCLRQTLYHLSHQCRNKIMSYFYFDIYEGFILCGLLFGQIYEYSIHFIKRGSHSFQ